MGFSENIVECTAPLRFKCLINQKIAIQEFTSTVPVLYCRHAARSHRGILVVAWKPALYRRRAVLLSEFKRLERDDIDVAENDWFVSGLDFQALIFGEHPHWAYTAEPQALLGASRARGATRLNDGENFVIRALGSEATSANSSATYQLGRVYSFQFHLHLHRSSWTLPNIEQSSFHLYLTVAHSEEMEGLVHLRLLTASSHSNAEVLELRQPLAPSDPPLFRKRPWACSSSFQAGAQHTLTAVYFFSNWCKSFRTRTTWTSEYLVIALHHEYRNIGCQATV